MALTLTTSSECTNGIGYAHLTGILGGSGNFRFELRRASDGGLQDAGGITRAGLPLDFDSIYDDAYTLTLFDLADETNQGEAELLLACGYTAPEGSGGPESLILDLVRWTNETAAGDDGTATIQAHGGVAPLTASLPELSLSQPATSGQPNTFTGLAPATYELEVSDSSNPPQVVRAQAMVGAYSAPVSGCLDEYATDYNADATTAGTCSYAPNWRSAWGPTGMAVRVPALPTQVKAYAEATLIIGFRQGHPLAEFRPLGAPIKLRATIGPDGYATFRIGQFLRSALGVEQEDGSRRLDINTATVDDYYVGYELRRATGEMLEHGYALNSARPDAELGEGTVLTSFATVPIWPGFVWKRAQLASRSAGRYGAMDEVYPSTVLLPCPPNGLPVAWLNPLGGFDFWVFQGRPTVGDSTDEGQTYSEPASGERRYSDRGASRRTIKATSGVFRGDALLAGLRTLWASPQAWYQPTPDSDWVAVTIEGGQRDVGRLGVLKNELAISFTEAAAVPVQGQ